MPPPTQTSSQPDGGNGGGELDGRGVEQAVLRAAQYVRMSTEHQQYSTQNQAQTIREYAERRRIEIVKTYSDDARSGLNIGGRVALQQLIADVESGAADFSAILVYDVTRWGRFQDADESAYYEYRCRKAGMQVAYCAEQFENDGSPTSTIVKSVKRAMAGEYSRELSVKVFAGQCRLIELGYRQGGSAGFGLRRVLIDERGRIKGELTRGEHKSLQTDRVILVPGPEEEVIWVNRMYRWLIDDDLSFREIADRLNEDGVMTDRDRPWTPNTVRTVLTNEKYIGNNVFNRSSFKLKKTHVENPPDMWVRKEGAFDGIVPLETYLSAAEIIAARTARLSDEEMLEHLLQLYADAGALSGVLIDQAPDMPSAAAYRTRFGSLARAYEMIGYRDDRSDERAALNKRLRAKYPEIIARTEAAIAAVGGSVVRDPTTDLISINDEITVSIVLARCEPMADGRLRWRIRFDPVRYQADVTLAVRLDPWNRSELDYYLLPWLDLPRQEIRLCNRTCIAFEVFRFEDVGFFYGMAERVGIRRKWR
jgi:DNA invertase Pin-like site-specific DNA recombinase